MFRRKSSLIAVIIILCLLVSASVSSSASSDPTSMPGMDKGIIFKAPLETDASKIGQLVKMDDIKGMEILLNWGDIEKEEGICDWSAVDSAIAKAKKEGKKSTVSVMAASFAINDTPEWVFTKYNVRRIAGGLWLNFENGDKGYDVSGNVVSDSVSLIGGKYSLQGSSNESEKVVLSTTSSQLLTSHVGYSVQFDYKLLSDAVFYVRVAPEKGEKAGEKYFEWSGKKGDIGSKTAEFTPEGKYGNYKVTFGIKSGSYVIDNVNIIERKDGFYVGTLTFPNYFDPMFKEKYANFVKHFSEKYYANPDVATIYVGGFGRWEEITLCDDTNPYRFEDQWVTFGYSDPKYIDHIKWCMDTYKKYFKDKKLMISAAGYPGADAFRDQILIDWKVEDFAAKMGIGLKYNGWQSKCTEWNPYQNAIYYIMNRYKHDPNVWALFEEGAPINSTFSEIMGNPISLINKALVNGADYMWIYPNDIMDVYTNRYFQYANESAGTALISKLYTILGKRPYYSTNARQILNHYNINMELYQVTDKKNARSDFIEINGVKCARTNANNNTMAFSLDDRQKYNGMYGSVLTIDYLDEGKDKFDIYGYTTTGPEKLGEVTKKGTGKWKTVSIYNQAWTNSSRGGKADLLTELEIDDMGDGFETIRSIEINYVPAIEWQENTVKSSEPNKTDGITFARNKVELEIPVESGTAVSGISLPVGYAKDSAYTYVNIKSEVQAKINGKYVPVVSKDYYMPGDMDWFYIPVANVPEAEAYKVTLKTDKGKAIWYTDTDGKPAYRVFSYVENAGAKTAVNKGQFETIYPYSGLEIEASGSMTGKELTLSKLMPGGSWQKNVVKAQIKSVNGSKAVVRFEPQTAGSYMLSVNGITVKSVKPLYVSRIQPAKKPTRDLKGTLVPEFAKDGKDMWGTVTGLKDLSKKDNVFSGLLLNKNPTIETTKKFNIPSNGTHIFHFIMKNETSAGFAKVYWKTDKGDYTEKNSTLIPIVSNDTEFREYSYPIGYESTWKGNITGLKVMPVYGHTSSGRVSIYTMDLRQGWKSFSEYNESLDIKKAKADGTVAVKGFFKQNLSLLSIGAAASVLLLATPAYIAFKGKKSK